MNYKREKDDVSKINTIGNKVEPPVVIKNIWPVLSKVKLKLKLITIMILSVSNAWVIYIVVQCPNKRVMVMRKCWEIESKSDTSKEDEIPPLKILII